MNRENNYNWNFFRLIWFNKIGTLYKWLFTFKLQCGDGHRVLKLLWICRMHSLFFYGTVAPLAVIVVQSAQQQITTLNAPFMEIVTDHTYYSPALLP